MYDTRCYYLTGIVGVLMQPFFSSENGILFSGNHYLSWIQLGINLLGMICIILWASAHALLIFGGLNHVGMLRVDLETELKGLDITKHGEDAYQTYDWNIRNVNTCTQTSLSLNCENYFQKNNKKSFLKYQLKQAKTSHDENEFVGMDNLQTILRSCKV